MHSHFGPVSDDFAMDDVQCIGDEDYIWRCPHATVDNCGSHEGAGVICSMYGPLPISVELVGGSGPNEGNLMVGGQPVCDDLWSEEDANVVCRQLGYLHGQPTSNSQFGSVNTDFAMDDVQCNGDEELLIVCPFSTTHNCGASEGAGVICSNGEGLGSGSGQGDRSTYVCYHWSPEDRAAITALGSSVDAERSVCEGLGHVFTQGDASLAPGCGDCFCCQEAVEVAVLVKSATTEGSLEGASVEMNFNDDLVLSGTTDSEGVAVFTVSSDFLGQWATIVVVREGYATVTITREIYAGELINIFASPDLAAGEHRIVLSWETERDLDIYALGRDRTTGDIVCKTWYADRGGCAGVNLDVDNTYGYGPETITWTDADNDLYVYELYVNDYDGIGIAGTGAHIVLYGESTIELDVETVGSEEMWWMLGTFEPSVGISSFQEVDALQTSNPDDREETAIARQLSRSKKWRGGKKPKGKKLKKDKKEE